MVSPQDLLSRNAVYAQTHRPLPNFTPEGLASRKALLIISCLDPRIHPEEFLGLNLGEAAVIRNAGGRARMCVFDAAFLDTLTSVENIVVIHHTNCGLTLTSDERTVEKLGARSKEQLAKYEVEVFCFTDVPGSVKDDVLFLREHPFVRKETTVTGLVYDIETGKVEQIDV